METPRKLELVAGDHHDVTIREREYDGRSVVAVDFGPTARPAVDVVGGTAIVVLDDRQVEFEVPDRAEEVTITNGVLTVRERVADR